jgi:heme/copper-type cytochrome/quinol oxidase subunit 3
MQNQDLLEQELTREERQKLANNRTGMAIFQISWILAFVCLVIVNWQLRFGYTEWPPPGVEPMGKLVPSFATAALLVSVWLSRRGLTAMREGNRHAFLTQWGAAIGLGALFVGVMVYEWLIVPMGTQYGAIFRLMTAFHAVHALAIGLYMANVYFKARNGHYGSGGYDIWWIEAGVKLWAFVAVAWLLFFAVLYWI